MRRHIATITVGLACLVVLAVGAVLIYEFLKDIDTKKLDNPTKTTTKSHVLMTSTTIKPTSATPLATGKHESSSIWSSGQPVSSVSSTKNSSGNKTTATASPDKASSTERATTATSSVMTRAHERSSTGSSDQPPTSVIQTYSPPAKETTATPSSPEQSSTTERSTTTDTSPETEQLGSPSVLTSSSAHPSNTTRPLSTSQPSLSSSTNSNSNANETTTETTTFPSNQEKATEAASTSSEQLKETGSTPDTAFITITNSKDRGDRVTSTQTRMPIEDLFPGQPLHALWEDSQRDSD